MVDMEVINVGVRRVGRRSGWARGVMSLVGSQWVERSALSFGVIKDSYIEWVGVQRRVMLPRNMQKVGGGGWLLSSFSFLCWRICLLTVWFCSYNTISSFCSMVSVINSTIIFSFPTCRFHIPKKIQCGLQ